MGNIASQIKKKATKSKRWKLFFPNDPLPTFITIAFISLFGKVDDYTGGALSGRRKKRIVVYNNGVPTTEKFQD